MEEELTEEMINELCSFMRTVEFMKKNEKIWKSNPEVKKTYDDASRGLNEIMEALTEEQKNIVLEMHRKQLKNINKKK